MHFTPLQELEFRIQRLQQAMIAKKLEMVLVMENTDLFYFTGTAQAGWLFVPAAGRPLLLVRRDVARAEQECPLRPLIPVGGYREIPALLKTNRLPVTETMGMELDVLPVKEFWRYQQIFPQTRIDDASGIIRQVRMIKTAYEIERIRQSAALHDRMFSHVESVLREGMTEVELAAEAEAFSRRQGHQGYVSFRGFNMQIFYGHLMSGPQAAVSSSAESPTGGLGLAPSCPQSASLQPIRRDTPVLVDYVGRYNSYLVDETRIYVLGRLPEKLTRAYRVALDIQEEIIREARPGVNGADLYQRSVDMVNRAGLSEYYMGYGSQVSFMGHGLGLELNELPVLARGFDVEMEPGMVLALEPKFVFPGEGVVGIENTFLMTSLGLEKLTKYPEEVMAL